MEIDSIFFQQINPTVAVRLLCEVGGVADSTLTTLKGSTEVDSTFPTPSTEYHIPAMSLDRVVTMIGNISNPEAFKRTLGRLSFQTLANLPAEEMAGWLGGDEICLEPFSVPSTVYNSEGFQENIEDLGAILRNEAGAGDLDLHLDDRIIISGEVGGGDSNGKEKSKNRWILPAAVAVLGIGGFLWWRKSQS